MGLSAAEKQLNRHHDLQSMLAVLLCDWLCAGDFQQGPVLCLIWAPSCRNIAVVCCTLLLLCPNVAALQPGVQQHRDKANPEGQGFCFSCLPAKCFNLYVWLHAQRLLADLQGQVFCLP